MNDEIDPNSAPSLASDPQIQPENAGAGSSDPILEAATAPTVPSMDEFAAIEEDVNPGATAAEEPEPLPYYTQEQVEAACKHINGRPVDLTAAGKGFGIAFAIDGESLFIVTKQAIERFATLEDAQRSNAMSYSQRIHPR